MVFLFGHQIKLPESLQFLPDVYMSLVATALAWFGIGLILYVLLTIVLKVVARRVPGEIDDVILGIVRKPLLLLSVVFGTANSLEALQLPSPFISLIENTANSILTLVIVYLAWRITKDVVIYYGSSWVKKTESRIDDIILPTVQLFVPLLLGFIALAVILSIWGINITSVLVGAGVVGLVLGLALQDTLSNIFSGVSLLIDAPFRTGDLITLADGKICEVQSIGLRATELYHLDEHSTIYVPNRELANTMIVNITKPTVDLKVSIDIGVGYDSDLERVAQVLESIAREHPNVLGDIPKKLEILRGKVTVLGVGKKAEEYQIAIRKLEKEYALGEATATLKEALRSLASEISTKEKGGLVANEREELEDRFVPQIDQLIKNVVQSMEGWSNIADPQAVPEEVISEGLRWQQRNEWLLRRWQTFKQALHHPRNEQEMRLDSLALDFARLIETEYKTVTESWKEPQVTFRGFGPSSVDVQLDFYVDDIRLEHFERKQRVVTEIAQAIHKRFQDEGIEIPFTQMDIRLAQQQMDMKLRKEDRGPGE